MTVKELFKLPIYDCGFYFATADLKGEYICDTFNFEVDEIIEKIGNKKVDGITIGDFEELIVRVVL